VVQPVNLRETGLFLSFFSFKNTFYATEAKNCFDAVRGESNKSDILHCMQLFPKCMPSFVQLYLLMSHTAQTILDLGCKHKVIDSEVCVTDINSPNIRRQSTNNHYFSNSGFPCFLCTLTTQQNVLSVGILHLV
jgi:hypothetical protein